MAYESDALTTRPHANSQTLQICLGSHSQWQVKPASRLCGQWLKHGKLPALWQGKFTGALTLGQRLKGKLDPEGRQINFAVLSDKTLRKKNNSLVTLPKNVQPGLLHPILDICKDESAAYVISLDGKLLRKGLHLHMET